MWVHWLQVIMKKNLLHNFIYCIPVEQQVSNDQQKAAPGIPRTATILPPQFYTKMFVHFIKKQDFEGVEKLLALLMQKAEHAINAEFLTQELKPYLDRESTGHNPHLLTALYQLYKLAYMYENAFYTILKKEDVEVFKFLSKRPIDFPLNPTLGKLLRIDAK